MRRWVRDGIAFAALYYAVELFGSVALLVWLGAGLDLFRLLGWHLARLLLEYVGIGALAGAALGMTFRAGPSRWPALGLPIRAASVAAVFAALALFWNTESYLPRRHYLLQDGAALAVITVVAGLSWLFARLRGSVRVRLGPLLLPRFALAGALVIAASAVAAISSFTALRGGSTDDSGVRSAESPRPNVLLIVLDTVRPDHLSAYGYERRTSPWLERLAREGALFEQAFSTAPWTLPAHASLFTGRPVATHGTDSTQSELPQAYDTVAELARGRGYRTGLFSANAWVSPVTALDQGFERVAFAGARSLTAASFVSLAAERMAVLLGRGDADAGADAVTTGVIDWIHRADDARAPFLVIANYMEAHEPYGTVPHPYARRFLADDLPRAAGRVWVRDTPLFLCRSCNGGIESGNGIACESGRWRVSGERARHAAALYDGSLRYLDDHIGRVYRALAARRLLNDTVVIVTSDHGESLGEHGRIGHGAFLTNTVLRVPLVVRFPAVFAPGARVEAPVTLLDVYPTIRRILGLPGDADAPGTSLTELSAVQRRPVRVLAEYHPIPERVWRAAGRRLGCDYGLAARRSVSLQDERFKYVWSSDGTSELYDIVNDPGETVGAIDPHGETAVRLKRELEATIAGFERQRERRPLRTVDPGVRDLLRSLGYVR